MNPHDHDPLDPALEDALASIRDERLGNAEADAALERVRGRLGAGAALRIEGCAGVQRLRERYLGGGLEEPVRLLVEDHLGSCIACRKAFRRPPAKTEARGPSSERAAPPTVWLRWAAGLLLAVAVGWSAWWALSRPDSPLALQHPARVHLEEVRGSVFHMHGHEGLRLEEGATVHLAEDERLRTGPGAYARLSLPDGSRLELGERSELAVEQHRPRLRGGKLERILSLYRGSLIVEAAPQGAGHLRLRTSDCMVSVQGTVFTVRAGTKGSRISVLEGQVEVAQGDRLSVLEPGDQYTSSRRLEPAPLAEDVAWSPERARYLALVEELEALQRSLDQELPPLPARHESDLVARLPRDTWAVISLPNAAEQLRVAYARLQEAAATSPALRPWWEQSVEGSFEASVWSALVEHASDWGDRLGDEILVGLAGGGPGSPPSATILARWDASDEAAAFVEREFASLRAAGIPLPDLVWLSPDGPPPAAATPRLYGCVRGGVVALASDPAALACVIEDAPAPEATFAGSAFHADVVDLYRQGVEWMAAVDLERWIRTAGRGDPRARDALHRAGLDDVRVAGVVGRREGERTEVRFRLGLRGPRRGLLNWLSEPSPMAALGFVSQDATLVVDVTFRDPVELMDDLVGLVGDPDAAGEALDRFRRDSGVDFRDDLVQSLGGELLVSLDGPLFPEPGLKFAVEVNQPQRLQRSLEQLARSLAAREDIEGEAPVRIEAVSRDGAPAFRVSGALFPVDLYYTYHRGYLVAATSRALMEQAVELERKHLGLAFAPGFRALLPADAQPDASALVYQRIDPMLQSLASQWLSRYSPDLPASPAPSPSSPALGLVYARPDGIEAVSSHEGTLVGQALMRFVLMHALASDAGRRDEGP